MIVQLSCKCTHMMKVVLDCTIIYILSIIENKGNVSPVNDCSVMFVSFNAV